MAYSNKQIIDALEKTHGNISAAARSIGASRTTVHNRINKSDKVKEAYNSVNEANLDLAENELMELVRDGNFRAIKFYLRTKGRTRGYGDRMDITSGGISLFEALTEQHEPDNKS